MSDWTAILKTNPIPKLLEIGELGLTNRIQRDLLDKKTGLAKEPVVDDSEYKTLVRRQKPDGSWREAGRKKNELNWTFITTLRSLYRLIDLGSRSGDEVFDRGAAFILGTQTEIGDFRGAYGPDIPSPDYTGMTVEVLFHGKCNCNKALIRALEWLVEARRNDGGWAIPGLRSQSKKDPSSHNVTGMALRGFAAEPNGQFSDEAKKAGELLANRIFEPDKYPHRRGVEYWGKLSYPFWFTDALSALDVLSRLSFDLSTGKMQRAFDWLIKQQDKDGFWHSDFRKNRMSADPWLTYAALRTIKAIINNE